MDVVKAQSINDQWAIYNADCMDVMRQFPDASMHLSVYSPPFAGMYQYSSNEKDLSNNATYDEFMKHYGYVISELARVTMAGRFTAVHCMDIPDGNTGRGDGLKDFPGDIIRLHEKNGWTYNARYHVWKEPLAVRNRTMKKSLAHQTIVNDATKCSVASADYVLVFRRDGDNPVPVTHPDGLHTYAGERPIPESLYQYRNWKGKQIENRLSHWIWRQYASAFWDDIRLDRVMKYKPARDVEDEKHVHPLQLDVIERIVTLWSNEGEKVFTPFMGVGSEVYGAVINNRIGIGVELKPSYYRQAEKNLIEAVSNSYSEVSLL